MKLQLKKLGNHWYINMNHSSKDMISLDYRLELYIDKVLKIKTNTLNLEFVDLGEIFILENTLLFNEEDITRFLTTTDDFELKFKFNNFKFTLHSDLMFLLESNFNFNFHKTIYNIEYGI